MQMKGGVCLKDVFTCSYIGGLETVWVMIFFIGIWVMMFPLCLMSLIIKGATIELMPMETLYLIA